MTFRNCLLSVPFFKFYVVGNILVISPIFISDGLIRDPAPSSLLDIQEFTSKNVGGLKCCSILDTHILNIVVKRRSYVSFPHLKTVSYDDYYYCVVYASFEICLSHTI